MHTVTLIPGDGVGPEVTEATVRVIEATGVKFQWDEVIAGGRAQDVYGTSLPDYLFDSITRNRVALKGPITTPTGSGFRSVNVALRKKLDLYACIRPCKSYPGAPSVHSDVDLVVIRENTEDLYMGIEFGKDTPEATKLLHIISKGGTGQVKPDSAFSIKAISESASRRIARFAFEYARKYGRKRVTAVHKANILKVTDGLFLSTTTDVARGYPDIRFDSVIIDSLCNQLVRNPRQYEVLVMPNLYGDIVSDLCAGIIGGLGLAPGANIGDAIAVFEPTHGSAPKYAGQNKVNPMAMMLSAVLMLRHIGEPEAASRIERAIAQVIAEGRSVTYDMKPHHDDPTAVGTSQVVDFPYATECCGSYQILSNPDSVSQRAWDILSSALRRKAEAIALTCPLCECNLGQVQAELKQRYAQFKEIPIVYFSQLLAISLGLDPAVCRFELNYTDPRPLLESKGFLRK